MHVCMRACVRVFSCLYAHTYVCTYVLYRQKNMAYVSLTIFQKSMYVCTHIQIIAEQVYNNYNTIANFPNIFLTGGEVPTQL